MENVFPSANLWEAARWFMTSRMNGVPSYRVTLRRSWWMTAFFLVTRLLLLLASEFLNYDIVVAGELLHEGDLKFGPTFASSSPGEILVTMVTWAMSEELVLDRGCNTANAEHTA